jgi:branched-chain amino acid transport system substrate-binding protein
MRPTALISIWVLALMLSTCGGGEGEQEPEIPPARALDASGCSPVLFGGPGGPDLRVVGSTALQGQFIDHGVQIAQSLRLVLAERDWRAGEFGVGLQLCDETTAASSDDSDPERCRSNAQRFSRNRSVIAVAGPWSTTCALEMLPILNRAAGGPLAAISGSTTYVGLTRPGPGVARGEPAKYFPTGRRSFVRVVPADDVQGAAGAVFVKRQDAGRVFVLNDDQPYGSGIAEAFRLTAERSGLNVVGTEAWDPDAHDFRDLADRVRAAGADAVYLGGFVSNNGVRLIKDLRAALGPEGLIVGPDGFATPGLIVEGAGAAAEGFTWTIPTLPNDRLPESGRELAAEFEQRFGSAPCCFAVQAAESASMIMEAIESSDGRRSQVNENLLDARVEDGYLGDFAIDRYGDTTLTTFGVYRIEEGRVRFDTAIAPAAELVARR